MLQPGLIFIDNTPDGSRSGVSENVILAPTTTGGEGQIRSTNASDGTNIVTADFLNTEDVSFFFNDGSAGDTDALTVLGTGLSDTVTVDFTNVGLNIAGGTGMLTNPGAGTDLIDIDQGATQLVQVHGVARTTAVRRGCANVLGSQPRQLPTGRRR